MKHSAWIRTVAALLAVLTCQCSLLILPASAEEASADQEYEAKKAAYRKTIMADDVTTDDFLIGSWVSFYSFNKDSYEYQLDQMAAAGINFNMFPRDFGSGAMFNAEYWNNIEEQYAKRNMVYQMNGNMDPKNIAIGVEYATGKEHCVGYHLIDEPGGSALQGVADMVKSYREADPVRYPFVNLLPSYAGNAWLGGTYYEHVSRFVELAGPENIDYLSHDYYPFRAGNVVIQDIYADMEVLRKVAYENGKLKTHAFPQSTAWNGTRMPTMDEMRWNVYAYLVYGFKALSWFNLVCPGSSDTEGEGFRDSLIYRDGTIRDPELFAFWSELNWEVRGLSPILMNLDTVHAYHVQQNVTGVEYLPDDYFLQPEGRNDFIISVMEPKEGEDQYIMIFNKNTKRNVTSKLTVDAASGIKWLEYFDPQIGEYIPVEFEDGMLKEKFLPGEGKLYRLRSDDPPSETEAPTEAPTEPATDPVTEAPTPDTQAPVADTTAPAEEVTTVETPTEKSGCGSAVGFGVAAVLMVAAAAVVLKKREE